MAEATELADAAERALTLVGADPHAALTAADSVVAACPRPRTSDALRAVSTAHRAAGLALTSVGELLSGERRLRRAITVAERGDDAERAAEARMSLAYVLLERGRSRAALSSVDHASAVLTGVPAARVRTTRALVLQRCGRTREALDDYADALPVLMRAGDGAWEARLRNNRALLLAYEGDTEAAISDLHGARELYLAQQLPSMAADVLCNLGWVVGMSGAIPEALSLFDLADVECADLDRPERWVDRAEVLLRAGLVPDATASARRAVTWLTGRGWDALEAESGSSWPCVSTPPVRRHRPASRARPPVPCSPDRTGRRGRPWPATSS